MTMQLESADGGTIQFVDADKGFRIIRPDGKGFNRPSVLGAPNEYGLDQPLNIDRSNWWWAEMSQSERDAIVQFKLDTEAKETALTTPSGQVLDGVIVHLYTEENVDEEGNGLGTYQVRLGFLFSVLGLIPDLANTMAYQDDPLNWIELESGGDFLETELAIP